MCSAVRMPPRLVFLDKLCIHQTDATLKAQGIYGLAAFLQTGDKERAERVACKLRAGAVHINGAGIEYGTPFGGYKQSGNGREGGMMGLEDYLETKTLHGLG